jgi:hypothetical protein
MLNVSTLTGRLIGLVRSVSFIFYFCFVHHAQQQQQQQQQYNRDRDSIYPEVCFV